jgi:uncharacterized repeat protein (TIGR01451 family)
MRAALLGYGLLIAGIVLSTATVHGQDGPYSATRKMQGVTRYSSNNNTSSNNTNSNDNSGQTPHQAAPVDTPVTAPAVEIDPESASDTPSSVMKSTPADAQPPATSTAPQQPTVKAVVRPTPGGDAAIGSSGGLRAFQQRLAAVRNAAPADGSLAQAQMPRVAMPGAAADPLSVEGPMYGPNAPSMPDIHLTQTPPTSFSNPTPDVEPVPVRAVEPTPVVSGVTTSPVVNGPVSISRRISMGHEERPTPDAAAILGPSAPAAKTDENSNSNILFAQQSPLLGVETIGPRSVNVGKEATYTVAVTNTGQTAVQDLTISIKIPAWTDVVDAKTSNGAARSAANGEPLTWRLARLEAHSKEQIVLRLVPRESRPFDLAVQWTFSPVASQAMVEVKEPKLTMSLSGPKEVLYGQTKVYKLSLANPGTGDAENVVLFLSPVDGGSGAPTRHDLGVIRSGDSKLVEVDLTARQAGTLQMKAAAMADGNLRAEVAEDIIVHRAGLKLVASGPESKFTGTAATFKVQVKNPGNATAENVLLAAMLPVGAKYISSSGGQYLPEQNKVVWSMPSLAAGTEQELEVRCTLSAPGANRLQVVGSAVGDLSDSTAANTNVEALADLKLEVSDPQGPIPVGDETTYEIHLRNRGTKAAENVDVAGYFSPGIEPISAQGATYDLSAGQVVFRPIASVAPGTELLLRIKARAEKAGNHVFRAEVVCPMAGSKLATEETTLFFGDTDRTPVRTAARPNADGELHAISQGDQPSQLQSVKK